MPESTALDLLKARLFTLVQGEVAEGGPIGGLLAGCWHEFALVARSFLAEHAV
jgi:hypothetical protein